MAQKAVYRVKRDYWWNMDGYTPLETTVIATFSDEEKARSLLEKLVEENKFKEKALEEIGKTGYYNKYSKYSFYIEPIYLED